MTSNGGPLFEKYPVNTTWELMLEGSDQAVTGRIYTTDEASGVVVLQSALAHTTLATEMRVIQASSIKEAKIVEETEEEKAKNPPLVLPKVQKKALEEREKRALKMAEESLRHINQKASPKGQAIFDRLVKACGEVTWKDESIVVLKEIQVDAPYEPDNCRVIAGVSGQKAADSLERVKKIVAGNSLTYQ